ncbi:MAG: NUDIX hydrolase [Deltaproteobacteria bacterium]|nr:NUDIX hydrolase [Deltaproteobacteria bacterium]MBM4297144.1 NUDIX hydrolase [Deltaproteobacteria bacterium]
MVNGERTKRRLVCENSRFHVYFDAVQTPGHAAVNDYLVVAPKVAAENFVTGVAVLPVVDGKIGLLRVYRHAVQSDSWEIPRGFIEVGENDQSGSALRELEEETGLSCDREQLRSLGLVTPEAGLLAARVHLYVALRCRSIRPYFPAETGHVEFRVFDAEEVKNMISRSKIEDPCTVTAYFKFSTR